MNTVIKFKDGDGEEMEVKLESVSIDVVDNGYSVCYTYDDDEIREVFQYKDRQEMLKSLGKKLGV